MAINIGGGASVNKFDSPQRHSLRKLPINVNVAEPERDRKGVTLEADTQCAPDCSMRTIATDDIAKAGARYGRGAAL